MGDTARDRDSDRCDSSSHREHEPKYSHTGSLSVLGTPVKVGSLVVLFLFGLVPACALWRWTAVGVEVERPQRSEDERP